MINAIDKEIALQKTYLHEKVETIYFGGGTPSLLSTSQLRNLLLRVNTYYQVVDDAEVTIEANPEDLTVDKCLLLRSIGFNRISIGIQSFNNDILSFLNRNHNANMAEQSIVNARSAGFDNINLELIFGIPQQ